MKKINEKNIKCKDLFNTFHNFFNKILEYFYFINDIREIYVFNKNRIICNKNNEIIKYCYRYMCDNLFWIILIFLISIRIILSFMQLRKYSKKIFYEI